MASSTIPAVHDALVDGLRILEGIGGVMVYDGDTTKPERESIVVGNVVNPNEQWVGLGAKQREEDYEIDLFVWVWKPGGTPRDVRTRAFAIFAEIEAFLRDQMQGPLLGHRGPDPQVTNVELLLRRALDFLKDDGRGHVIEAAVHIKSRI